MLWVPPAMLVYQFPENSKTNYVLDAEFKGFLPILGGNEGKVNAHLEILVTGLKPEGTAERLVHTELTAAKILFNDAELPLDVSNVAKFFPPAEVTFDTSGKTLKTTAKEVDVPVQLPGLDVRRLPDITFLPIQFDGDKTTWTFKKNFAGGDIEYSVVQKTRTDKEAVFDITIQQNYVTLEDESMNVTKESMDAVRRVSTSMKGSGQATMDVLSGQFVKTEMHAESVSDVEEVSTHAKSVRKLASKLTVLRKNR